MACFQAKICWKRLRNSEKKKKIVPKSSQLTPNREFQKNSNKNSKN